jgi:hypothetical protein
MTEEELPKPAETRNEINGDVRGNAVQARDIEGGVHQYVVLPPPVPPPPPPHPARLLLPFLPHLVAAVVVGSLAAILVARHDALPLRLLAVLAALAPFALVAVLFRRWDLIGRCTPSVLREAGAWPLTALAVLALVLAAGALVMEPRLWDGYPQRDAVVLAVLFADVAALSIRQAVRRD